MSVRYGLLALLERGTMYGYQLRVAFEEFTTRGPRVDRVTQDAGEGALGQAFFEGLIRKVILRQVGLEHQ